jgi:hypothetical protein
MVLGHLLTSVQLHSFLEGPRSRFEQSVVRFYPILLEEHLQVALKVLEIGICSLLCSLQN